MAKHYKYLPFGRTNSNRRKWTMDIFNHNRLFLGHYEDLNDPMESFFNESELTSKQMYNIKTRKPHFVIGCFAQSYSDILMWTHYADSHKGCCIEFEVSHNDEECMHSVKYEDSIVEPDENSGVVEQCQCILRHKLSAWEYEQEYRYLRDLNPEDSGLQFLNVHITNVYLGVRLTKNAVAHYTNLIHLQNPRIPVRQIRHNEFTWYKNENNAHIF